MLDDAQQALVDDADNAGGGHDRHLADQRHGDLLEQESEAATLDLLILDTWVMLDQELESPAVPLGSSLGTVTSFNASV